MKLFQKLVVICVVGGLFLLSLQALIFHRFSHPSPDLFKSPLVDPRRSGHHRHVDPEVLVDEDESLGTDIGEPVVAKLTVDQDRPTQQQQQQQQQPVKNKQLTLTFYYQWYQSVEKDGQWGHWNHEILYQDPTRTKIKFSPPNEIGANFYPLLGPYSSGDRVVVDQHMRMIARAGIQVVCVTWWGDRGADGQLLGKHGDGYTHALVPLLLDAAAEHGLFICFHIEPYAGRSANSVHLNLRQLNRDFGHHPAYYRDPVHGRPLFFIYDSYLTPKTEWSTVLKPGGVSSIRDHPDDDSTVVALVVQQHQMQEAVDAGFDGFYTYFATDGFSWGSTHSHFPAQKKFAEEHKLLYVPCVGPGYLDTKIRPWNAKNQRDRMNGVYFQHGLRAAKAVHPDIVGITSFNEWHEGTQIEPAQKKEGYEDYGVVDPYFYIDYIHKILGPL